MLLKRSTQYNLLVVKTVKALLSTSRADITLANIATSDKIPGTIVYVQDNLQHVFWNGLLWTPVGDINYANGTYTYIGHFTGSQLNDTCNTYWTDMKLTNGIPSAYYVSYPVVGHVFYLSGSMSSIYTSQSNTVVYQNGGNGRTYNVWFTPQTSSGWVGTASIAIQYTVHL